MGHQVQRADTRLFFEISGGIRPENKKQEKLIFSILQK
ncbi:hypothetical protein MmTuc01_2004 [Methanosarcina mazei Tuc01]|uniref:Uncharacterized protein n=1 Tax=Methanosarcina mazei Tuc01 TaxID=1236903 RepID=M1PA08_METMZ|nr:hypothetical protein MmTuc01_2004 [Methanosarcina mazei Tuc01]